MYLQSFFKHPSYFFHFFNSFFLPTFIFFSVPFSHSPYSISCIIFFTFFMAKYQTPLGTEDDPYTYRDVSMLLSIFISLSLALAAYAYAMKQLILKNYINILYTPLIWLLLALFNIKIFYPWIYKDVLLANKGKAMKNE